MQYKCLLYNTILYVMVKHITDFRHSSANVYSLTIDELTANLIFSQNPVFSLFLIFYINI